MADNNLRIKKVELYDQKGISRGYYNPDNTVNDLTGKEWIFSTKTVIPKNYPPSFQHELRNQHGGQKPPELCESIIRTFTKQREIVLDPFAGVGGTLIGCSLSHRQGIGIEINKKWVDIYENIIHDSNLPKQTMICGDSRKQLKILKKDYEEKINFILTDVPFWKMDVVPKSKGTYKRYGEKAKGIFSEKSKLKNFNDLQDKNTSKEEWNELIRIIFQDCYELLKPNGYCAVFIGNMYFDGQYHLLNSDIAHILSTIGYILKGEIIWYDVAKKLHLYGINYSWIPSIVHQFIMIFRKDK